MEVIFMCGRYKKMISFFLASIISFMCFSVSAFAAEANEVIKYKVSDDGYAIVSDCDETAAGSVDIPSEVSINGGNYKVKYIANRAFDGCCYITGITLPEGVTVIGNHAFRDCVAIENLYVPESLIVCQFDAFDGCGKVTVHCYSSNYQFFSVFGFSSNITIDILDKDSVIAEPDEGNTSSSNFITNFVEALKKMINSIIEFFKEDDDFEFDLPFDLPFEIPV